jgi:hypothetical protein
VQLLGGAEFLVCRSRPRISPRCFVLRLVPGRISATST